MLISVPGSRKVKFRMSNNSMGYTKLPAGHPFRKHSENLKALLSGLKQAERLHKEMIRRGDLPAIEFASRMHALMIGMIAEAHLGKIVSDPCGFNERERKLIGRSRSQIERWKSAIEFAFRRQYSIPMHLEIKDSHIDPKVISRYADIISMLDGELQPIIEDRNKTAHGQWIWYLNNEETNFKSKAAHPLNYLAVSRRGKIIDNIARIIHILIVSEPTFQRDFDRLYGKVAAVKAVANGDDYPQFEARMRHSMSHRILSLKENRS